MVKSEYGANELNNVGVNNGIRKIGSRTDGGTLSVNSVEGYEKHNMKKRSNMSVPRHKDFTSAQLQNARLVALFDKMNAKIEET